MLSCFSVPCVWCKGDLTVLLAWTGVVDGTEVALRAVWWLVCAPCVLRPVPVVCASSGVFWCLSPHPALLRASTWALLPTLPASQ